MASGTHPLAGNCHAVEFAEEEECKSSRLLSFTGAPE